MLWYTAPLVDTAGVTGAPALALLAAKVQHFAAGSNVRSAASLARHLPSASARGGNANLLGKAIRDEPARLAQACGPRPTSSRLTRLCPGFVRDDQTSVRSSRTTTTPARRARSAARTTECDATPRSTSRRASASTTIYTGADGFAWKYGLWVLNYLQVMHDSTEAAVSTVAPADLANVGAPANQIVGADDASSRHGAGGRSSARATSRKLPGGQAIFIEEIDNRAEDCAHAPHDST